MSNVYKSDRKETKMLYYETVKDINKEINSLIQRDFGHKKRGFSLQSACESHIISDTCKKEIIELLEKDNINPDAYKLFVTYPSIPLKEDEEYMYRAASLLMDFAIQIKELYPKDIFSYITRRWYIIKARVVCKQILKKIEIIIEIHGLQERTFKKLNELLINELKYLKGISGRDEDDFPEYYEKIKTLDMNNKDDDEFIQSFYHRLPFLEILTNNMYTLF